MKTSLVIMAAGIGSRFGGGIKQLAPVGPNGEIIMDYSIHDALEAGFDRVVFIIRHDLEKDFREIIGNRIEKICPVAYAFQEKENLPEGFTCPAERKKPWGTGQAVLSCRGIVNEPFLVINADDYYGKEGFRIAHDFLVENAGKKASFCMPGFILKNTLSDNGAVTRGICQANAEGYLMRVVETGGLVRDGADAAVEKDGVRTPVDENSIVSMNMWALTPDFLDELAEGFPKFLAGVKEGDYKAEYLLPGVIDDMIQSGRATVRVIPTPDKWFGVTYAEDKQSVIDAFADLYEQGVYNKENLYAE
ncbi:MAG: NTP transferase domain-containing protein [Clostridia bacterium]|nr:NTP transferase domain-containing protein [Clostridia bacterium]